MHPQIHPSVYINEIAYVLGAVTIGEGSSVWPSAVVRADPGPIVIGRHTHIEDNVTVHAAVEIGDNVTIGHNAVVHCKSVGSRTLVGNHATLLDGAEIGSDCVVAAGAVVRPGTKVPDGSFVVGVPAEVRPLPQELKSHTHSWNDVYGPLAKRHIAAGLGDEIPPLSG